MLSKVARSKVSSSVLSRVLSTEAGPLTDYAFLQNTPATEVTTLPNGLRVASEGSHGETATVGIWIDAGSRDETEANNGVAHFFEHLAFKGTGKRDRETMEREIEGIGGHLNAYTSREQTAFYAQVMKGDVKQGLEIISDIVQHSQLQPEAVEREKNVIMQEMAEVNKIQEELVFDNLHETAFQGAGLGRTILGPAQNINTMSQVDLTSFIAENYNASRVVVAASGAVDHQELVKMSEELFKDLPSAKQPEDTSTRVSVWDFSFHFKNLSLVQINIHFIYFHND